MFHAQRDDDLIGYSKKITQKLCRQLFKWVAGTTMQRGVFGRIKLFKTLIQFPSVLFLTVRRKHEKDPARKVVLEWESDGK